MMIVNRFGARVEVAVKPRSAGSSRPGCLSERIGACM